MSDIGSATRSHYDRYPYDFETSLHESMQEDSLLGQALSEVTDRDVVLDAGCGTGLVSRLARRNTPARAVIGVDLSRGSLRENASLSRGVDLSQGNILELPIPDDRVDLVVSRGVIMTTGQPRRAFAELARVVRPGGRVFVRVYHSRHPYRWLYQLFSPICRAVERLPGGRSLLTLTVFPPFLLVIELAFLLIQGRFARIGFRRGWNFFADQFLVPHNSFHTIDELKEWGAREGLSCEGARSITLGYQIEALFRKPAG